MRRIKGRKFVRWIVRWFDKDISVADNKLHFDHGSSAPLPTEAAADEAAAGRFGAGHTEEIYERKIEVGDRAGIRAAQVSTNIKSQP